MEFKRPGLSLIPTLRDFFSRYNYERIADLTVAGTVMWRDFFKNEYYFEKDCFVLSAETKGGRGFYFPIGENTGAVAAALIEERKKEGLDTLFIGVSPDLLPFFDSYRTSAEADRDTWDYIYLSEDLSTLSGRPYAGQRNHINAFLKINTFEYKPITADNCAEVKDFFESTSRASSQDGDHYSRLAAAEDAVCREVFESWELYGFIGGAVYCDGRIIGAAVGDVVGDTLCVHIERADSSIRGAYQLTVREFAAHNRENGIKYINREDDAGIPGLRTAKLSYHPAMMAEKYSVTVFCD